MNDVKEVTKEEFQKIRQDILNQLRVLTNNYNHDTNYFYTENTIVTWKKKYLLKGAKLQWPRGYSKWTIRHFSPTGCSIDIEEWAKRPVTCLLISPDGRYYVSTHLPGFCSIHDMLHV